MTINGNSCLTTIGHWGLAARIISTYNMNYHVIITN